MNKGFDYKVKKILRTSKDVYGRNILEELLRPFWVCYYKIKERGRK